MGTSSSLVSGTTVRIIADFDDDEINEIVSVGAILRDLEGSETESIAPSTLTEILQDLERHSSLPQGHKGSVSAEEILKDLNASHRLGIRGASSVATPSIEEILRDLESTNTFRYNGEKIVTSELPSWMTEV